MLKTRLPFRDLDTVAVFIPWHEDLMLGDNQQTLTLGCHAQIEAEANYAAGQLLFLQGDFKKVANDTHPSIAAIRDLKTTYGNTITTTLWRYVEDCQGHLPMMGLISQHPNKPTIDFNAAEPFRYTIESPAFRAMFSPVNPTQLHAAIASLRHSTRWPFWVK